MYRGRMTSNSVLFRDLTLPLSLPEKLEPVCKITSPVPESNRLWALQLCFFPLKTCFIVKATDPYLPLSSSLPLFITAACEVRQGAIIVAMSAKLTFGEYNFQFCTSVQSGAQSLWGAEMELDVCDEMCNSRKLYSHWTGAD